MKTDTVTQCSVQMQCSKQSLVVLVNLQNFKGKLALHLHYETMTMPNMVGKKMRYTGADYVNNSQTFKVNSQHNWQEFCYVVHCCQNEAKVLLISLLNEMFCFAFIRYCRLLMMLFVQGSWIPVGHQTHQSHFSFNPAIHEDIPPSYVSCFRNLDKSLITSYNF